MVTNVPANAVLLRNLAMGANYLQSHILHFYHLVALDYVDVNGTGLIPKGFLCPNYDSNYYARGIDPVLQTGGLGVPAYTVNNAPVPNPGIPPGALGDLTPYFAGQYVRALKFRRMAHQVGALFTGKMPHASCFTPGCVTTRPYDPSATSGRDYEVRKKYEELMFGGPNWDPNTGGPYSVATPHQESLLGFIGKPADFWSWGANGFAPTDLPIWAQLGVPGAGTGPSGAPGASYTGTYLFDAVAAAHVFPEYFWFGAGYGRYLAWGIFEGADTMGFGDQRLLTRGRSHVPVNLRGTGTPYTFTPLGAEHYNSTGTTGSAAPDPKDICKEFTPSSWYDDPIGDVSGRHMWKGKTKQNVNKAGAYTFAKTPRYFWSVADGGPDDWVPYEVGPLARMMSNASGLTNPGGPATPGEVLAVQGGGAGAYYPGILSDVDLTLPTLPAFAALGPLGIGVMPNNQNRAPLTATATTNLTAYVTALLGLGVYYLPPNAVPATALNNTFNTDYYGGATLDRIAARALETYYVGVQMMSWFNSINPSQPVNTTKAFTWGGKTTRCAPKKSKGAGLTEAPRGALGHWIKIGKPKASPVFDKFRGKVGKYQIITPTAWNVSPKDHNGAMGPIERCISFTPMVNIAEPIEILRVVHSFDICCACTVHVMDAKKEEVAKVTLESIA
jgi:Ni,Fe-hydrogenase I large subunit